MANIPVRPAKRGVPWWLWALIVLALLAVLAYVFLLNDDAPEAADRTDADTSAEVAPPPATDDRLTALPPADDPDPDRYVGRTVRLDRARVARVLGDSAFTVQGDGGHEWVVVLDEPTGVSTAGSSAGFAVASGDVIRLDGTLRRADGGAVPEAARSALSEGSLYVAASAADVTPAAGADTTGTAPSTTDTTTT